MPAKSSLNINGELDAGQVSITPEEHADDRATRLEATKRQAKIRDYSDLAVFVVLLVAIVTVGIIAAYEGFGDGSASPETRRWGQTILSALMSGGISFVAGRKIGSK